jgi:hypothetical protein
MCTYRKWGTGRAKRGNFARVTRDPDIALSYDYNIKIAQEMDQELRNIFVKHAAEYCKNKEAER